MTLTELREAERDAALADAAKHRAKTEEARHLLSTLHVSVTDGHMHTALRAEHSCTMEALARLRDEADALRRELAAAREVLARDDVQWGGGAGRCLCPSCGAESIRGHAASCPIGAELREGV